jgi:hypothetical protein
VNLIFSYVHPNQPDITLGPLGAIWLSADGMRTEAGGELRAPYRRHQWDVDGLAYFRLDCTAHVIIHFERDGKRSGTHGPYGRFSAVNGLAYGDGKVLAFMDGKSDEWLFYDSGYLWPVMVIRETPQA